MFLFATIIYFGENPVGYDVHREERIFQFRPAVDSRNNFIPPVITAVNAGNEWIFEGASDNDIIEQLLRIIGLNELITLHQLNVAS